MVPSLVGSAAFAILLILLSPLWLADKWAEFWNDEERFS